MPKGAGPKASRELRVRAADALRASGMDDTQIATLLNGNPLRDDEAAEMWRTGKTLAEIGARFRVCRERARQILRDAGIDSAGGDRVRAALSRRDRESAKGAARDRRALRVFGCTLAEAREANDCQTLRSGGTKSKAFIEQKRSAGLRGIEWRLTFPEWARIWNESGKWPLRGRGRACYCMARIGDAGPYAVGNVEIITTIQNIKDSYINLPAAERALRYPRDELGLSPAVRRVYDAAKASGTQAPAYLAARLGIARGTVAGYTQKLRRLGLLPRDAQAA